MFKRVLGSLIVLLLSVSVASQGVFDLPPRALLPRMGKVCIDGHVTDSETKSMVGLTGFCQLSSSSKMMLLIPAEASFNLGTDGKSLYISSICEVGPQGLLSRARSGPGGAKVFHDDCFEFVFVPDPESSIPSIYHLIVNNKGSYMASCRKGPANMAWRPTFRSKGSILDGLWHFEIQVPVSEFGLKELSPGKDFGLRVCRNWKRTSRLYGGIGGCQSSWCQKRCAFFSVDALPLVRYEPGAPAVRFLSVVRGGKPDLRVSVYNTGQESLAFQSVYEHQPSESQSISRTDQVTLGGGETRVLTLPAVHVTSSETVSMGFVLRSLRGNTVYFRRAFRWSLAQPEFFQSGSGAPKKVSFKFAHYPESDQLFLQLDFSAMGQVVPTDLQAVLAEQGGRILAKASLPLPKDGLSEFLWRIPDLKQVTKTVNPSGKYRLTVFSEGKVPFRITKPLERRIFSWEGNQLGKSDRLLPRFTPMKVSGRTVSVVLRDYDMNAFGLFDQIHADGDVLLDDSGIHFEAVVDGLATKPVGEALTFTRQQASKVQATARWSAGKLKATADCDWDYDGLMKYRLTLEPFHGRLDSLKLVVPLLPRNAYLFHACTDGLRINYGGATPAGEGQVWNSTQAARRQLRTDYVNYIWLGTEGRGLAVCGENDKGWALNPKIPTQELIRKGDKLYLICNLVAKPIAVTSPRTLEIAFQATPVKPMAKNWRRSAIWNTPSRAIPHLDYHMVFLGSSLPYGGETHSCDLFPRNRDWTLFSLFREIRRNKAFPDSYTDITGKVHRFGRQDFARKFLDFWLKGYADQTRLETYRREVNFGLHTLRHAPKDLVTFYTNARGVRTDIPEAYTFRDSWLREEFQSARDREPPRPDPRTYSLDPTESFRDYAMTCYAKMLDSGACDNLYWDNVFLASNQDFSGRSGSYWLEDGGLQPSVGLWNMRELIRRAAVMQLEMGRTPNNMVHMTNTAIAPICAFAQQNVDWEDNLGTNPFQQRYTKEYIRALSIGRQFGNLPGALGLVVSQGDQKAIQWCLRTGAGVSLTHEILWCKGSPAKDYWHHLIELYRFGYGRDRVKVWNYWDKSYPVTVSGDTSSLVMSDCDCNSAILLVCDYGGGGDFTARLDLGALGVKGALSAVNWETGKPVSVKGDTLCFQLKKHDFIQLHVNGK